MTTSITNYLLTYIIIFQNFENMIIEQHENTQLTWDRTYHKLPKYSVSIGNNLLFFSAFEILYLKAEGNYTHIFLANKGSVVSARLLKDIEQLLDSKIFIRVHHSSIVNINQIKKINCDVNTSIEMNNRDIIHVSRRKKSELLDNLIKM